MDKLSRFSLGYLAEKYSAIPQASDENQAAILPIYLQNMMEKDGIVFNTPEFFKLLETLNRTQKPDLD